MRAGTWDRRASCLPPGLDERSYRARPLVTPTGQARRPASRPPAGRDDEDVLRSLEQVPPRRLVGSFHRPRQPGRPLEVGNAPAGMLDEKPLGPLPGPP